MGKEPIENSRGMKYNARNHRIGRSQPQGRNKERELGRASTKKMNQDEILKANTLNEKLSMPISKEKEECAQIFYQETIQTLQIRQRHEEGGKNNRSSTKREEEKTSGTLADTGSEPPERTCRPSRSVMKTGNPGPGRDKDEGREGKPTDRRVQADI